jgi:hypothetical protein
MASFLRLIGPGKCRGQPSQTQLAFMPSIKGVLAS